MHCPCNLLDRHPHDAVEQHYPHQRQLRVCLQVGEGRLSCSLGLRHADTLHLSVVVQVQPNQHLDRNLIRTPQLAASMDGSDGLPDAHRSLVILFPRMGRGGLCPASTQDDAHGQIRLRCMGSHYLDGPVRLWLLPSSKLRNLRSPTHCCSCYPPLVDLHPRPSIRSLQRLGLRGIFGV